MLLLIFFNGIDCDLSRFFLWKSEHACADTAEGDAFTVWIT